MTRQPPVDPWAQRVAGLLRRILPRRAADDVVGGLLEHYARRGPGRRLWLLAEAVKLTWGLRRTPAVVEAPPRRWMTDVWRRDLRYACRSLLRSRGFAAITLTSLGLGAGLTTAVFSVVNGVLLQPLPYGDSDAIVRIRETAPARPVGSDEVRRAVLGRWLQHSRTLGALAPYARADARMLVQGDAFVGLEIAVGHRFFDVLRTAPLHGRLLGQGDDQAGAPLVGVLSHGFWRDAFAGDPAAVGRQIAVNDRLVHVVGVLPAAFTYPSADAAIYLPGRWTWPVADGVTRASFGAPLEVIGRLADGAAPADVAQEGQAIASQQLPAGPAGPDSAKMDVVRLQADLTAGVRPALMVLLVSVGCVLAIVCVNLVNLLLARGTARQREIAVRAALGASRWDMTRPLVLEGLLLAAAGGAAGLLVASALIASLPLTATVDPQLAAQVRIDGRVVAFTVALIAGAGILLSLLPVWLAPASNLKDAVSGSHVHLVPGAALRAEQVRAGLVIAQVALAIVLAVGATLLARSLVSLMTVDLGFRPDGALSVQVRLPRSGGSTFGWQARFYERFVESLSAHPGVRAAGFSSVVPMHETFSQAAVRIDGVPPPDPGAAPRAHRETVTPRYFEAIGLPVTAGRGFLPTDTATSERVIVVNQAFAATFLAGREPIGQRIMQFGDWCRIVGVVASKRHGGLRAAARPEMYTPLTQSPPDVVTQSSAGVVLRTTGDPQALVPAVRSTLRGLQPEAALEDTGALADRVWESTAAPRFYAAVMGVFAALSVVTALVGLFGVLSYVVERRRVEIGLRRALGATGRDISSLVVSRGLRLVAVAMPIGFAGALAGVGLLRSLLFGIEPADPMTFVAVLVAVPLVATAACAWPARRAASIEPLEALRES